MNEWVTPQLFHKKNGTFVGLEQNIQYKMFSNQIVCVNYLGCRDIVINGLHGTWENLDGIRWGGALFKRMDAKICNLKSPYSWANWWALLLTRLVKLLTKRVFFKFHETSFHETSFFFAHETSAHETSAHETSLNSWAIDTKTVFIFLTVKMKVTRKDFEKLIFLRVKIFFMVVFWKNWFLKIRSCRGSSPTAVSIDGHPKRRAAGAIFF